MDLVSFIALQENNMPTLTQIIEDWIGGNITNTTKSSELYWKRYDEGHNQVLADLRSRVPELVELMREKLNEKKTEMLQLFCGQDIDCIVETQFKLDDIINSLTSN